MTGEQRNIGAELCERLSRIGGHLALTDAEREAIHWAVGDVADVTAVPEKTLRGLLDRTKDGGK